MKKDESTKKAIVSRVYHILKNRERVEGIERSIDKHKETISELSSETNMAIDVLKKDMGNTNTINVMVKGSYYSLTQNGSGVVIEEFKIDIFD